MSAVDIGIGHDDNLMVPKFTEVELIADTAANSDNSENSPYAAARYIERVVPNPAYSSGIVIHNEADGSSAAAGNTDAENAQLDTSKYSSKIVLNENATQSDVPYLNKKNAAEQEAQVSEEDFSDVEIADITEKQLIE